MKRFTAQQTHGFTLIEMVVVIVILGILAAVGSKAIQSGFTSYFTSQDLNNANWQGRLVIENMTRNIHSIRSPADITTASPTSLVFTDTGNASNNYTLASGTLSYNSQTLAPNISAPAGILFTYFASNGSSTAVLTNIRYITVTFTITINNVIYNYRTTINPLNLNQS